MTFRSSPGGIVAYPDSSTKRRERATASRTNVRTPSNVGGWFALRRSLTSRTSAFGRTFLASRASSSWCRETILLPKARTSRVPTPSSRSLSIRANFVLPTAKSVRETSSCPFSHAAWAFIADSADAAARSRRSISRSPRQACAAVRTSATSPGNSSATSIAISTHRRTGSTRAERVCCR